MKIAKKIILIVVLTVTSGVAFPSGYESNVIVSSDFSGSYFAEERFERIRGNYEKLARILTDPINGPKTPLLFQVTKIDERSQAKSKICEYKLKQRPSILIGPRPCEGEKNCSTNPRNFSTYVNDICMKTILGQDIGPETDIEGALSLAGQMAHGNRAKKNYLFLFSDMYEFSSNTIENSPINLDGVKIFVLCGGLQIDKFCMNQSLSWKRRLKEFGAESSEFVTEESEWSGAAREFFSE